MNQSHDRSIFCRNIRKVRQRNHLTPEEMADALKISVDALHALEAGTIPSQLSADIVFHISSRFHIEPSSLFIPME